MEKHNTKTVWRQFFLPCSLLFLGLFTGEPPNNGGRRCLCELRSCSHCSETKVWIHLKDRCSFATTYRIISV